MSAYATVTTEDVEALARIVGQDGVVTQEDEARLLVYGRDETADWQYRPEVVVLPRTTAHVAAIMAHATARRLPVTPRGAGTGLSGGALPVFGGIVLGLERMAQILEIDVANRMARVQPGVINQVLQEAVGKHGLYYAPDPASWGSCQIGGNLAENAGGPHAVKYGVTKDWVLALEAVLPSGEVMRTGGKLRKDVAGYNLTQLLVGSEGTLAIITEATLRLIPRPTARRTLVAPFADLDTAARAMVAVYGSKVMPSTLEVVERAALDAAAEHLGRPVPHQDAEGWLLLEVDGYDEATVERELTRAGEVLLEADALDVLVANTPAKERELWAVRRCLGEAVKKQAAYIECDTAVPPDQVPALFRGVREIAARHGVRQISYGHAGDGNIHVNVLTDHSDPAERERRLGPAVDEIFDLAVSLGGTITGEHGVGCVQSRYLAKCRDAAAIGVMRSIKQAFDPLAILHPGKVLPGDVPAPVGSTRRGART